ncbi:MAG: hypothetical protein ACRDPY_23885 [Streptosporangiaceae bacterium]
MTVHLISVGLSMLDAIGDPYSTLGDDDLAAAVAVNKPHEMLTKDTDRAAASAWLAGALAAPDDPGHSPADAVWLQEVSAAVRPDKWPRTISAEVQTFDRVEGTSFPLSEEDIAILICSDTPLGLLAGLWNALALTGGDLTRVRYLPDSRSFPAEVRGCAVLARVLGMDAGSSDGFREAMRHLGLLARNVFQFGQLSKADEFRFYLSGGFKAAIPYLIGLAEAVRSIDGSILRALNAQDAVPDQWPYPVKAFVLHETAETGAPSIQLPLRRLVASAVRKELANFDARGEFRGELRWDLLYGYAYELEGDERAKKYKITAFGEGLRALFGFTPEGFQG